MDTPNVFEVQTLKDGRWMIEQRCRNEDEAVAEAKDLFDSRHFQSVKVVKEAFDHAAKLYRETTVFSLPNGNSEPMVDTPKAAPEPRKTVRKNVAKPKKRSLLDFFRE
jgi:hypothetical protein